ncbi:MAG: hypothetical protein V2A72_02650 [Candidatus Omnitrophota bacterium]
MFDEKGEYKGTIKNSFSNDKNFTLIAITAPDGKGGVVNLRAKDGDQNKTHNLIAGHFGINVYYVRLSLGFKLEYDDKMKAKVWTAKTAIFDDSGNYEGIVKQYFNEDDFTFLGYYSQDGVRGGKDAFELATAIETASGGKISKDAVMRSAGTEVRKYAYVTKIAIFDENNNYVKSIEEQFERKDFTSQGYHEEGGGQPIADLGDYSRNATVNAIVAYIKKEMPGANVTRNSVASSLGFEVRGDSYIAKIALIDQNNNYLITIEQRFDEKFILKGYFTKDGCEFKKKGDEIDPRYFLNGVVDAIISYFEAKGVTIKKDAVAASLGFEVKDRFYVSKTVIYDEKAEYAQTIWQYFNKTDFTSEGYFDSEGNPLNNGEANPQFKDIVCAVTKKFDVTERAVVLSLGQRWENGYWVTDTPIQKEDGTMIYVENRMEPGTYRMEIYYDGNPYASMKSLAEELIYSCVASPDVIMSALGYAKCDGKWITEVEIHREDGTVIYAENHLKLEGSALRDLNIYYKDITEMQGSYYTLPELVDACIASEKEIMTSFGYEECVIVSEQGNVYKYWVSDIIMYEADGSKVYLENLTEQGSLNNMGYFYNGKHYTTKGLLDNGIVSEEAIFKALGQKDEGKYWASEVMIYDKDSDTRVWIEARTEKETLNNQGYFTLEGKEIGKDFRDVTKVIVKKSDGFISEKAVMASFGLEDRGDSWASMILVYNNDNNERVWIESRFEKGTLEHAGFYNAAGIKIGTEVLATIQNIIMTSKGAISARAALEAFDITYDKEKQAYRFDAININGDVLTKTTVYYDKDTFRIRQDITCSETTVTFDSGIVTKVSKVGEEEPKLTVDMSNVDYNERTEGSEVLGIATLEDGRQIMGMLPDTSLKIRFVGNEDVTRTISTGDDSFELTFDLGQGQGSYELNADGTITLGCGIAVSEGRTLTEGTRISLVNDYTITSGRLLCPTGQNAVTVGDITKVISEGSSAGSSDKNDEVKPETYYDSKLQKMWGIVYIENDSVVVKSDQLVIMRNSPMIKFLPAGANTSEIVVEGKNIRAYMESGDHNFSFSSNSFVLELKGEDISGKKRSIDVYYYINYRDGVDRTDKTRKLAIFEIGKKEEFEQVAYGVDPVKGDGFKYELPGGGCVILYAKGNNKAYFYEDFTPAPACPAVITDIVEKYETQHDGLEEEMQLISSLPYINGFDTKDIKENIAQRKDNMVAELELTEQSGTAHFYDDKGELYKVTGTLIYKKDGEDVYQEPSVWNYYPADKDVSDTVAGETVTAHFEKGYDFTDSYLEGFDTGRATFTVGASDIETEPINGHSITLKAGGTYDYNYTPQTIGSKTEYKYNGQVYKTLTKKSEDELGWDLEVTRGKKLNIEHLGMKYQGRDVTHLHVEPYKVQVDSEGNANGTRQETYYTRDGKSFGSNVSWYVLIGTSIIMTWEDGLYNYKPFDNGPGNNLTLAGSLLNTVLAITPLYTVYHFFMIEKRNGQNIVSALVNTATLGLSRWLTDSAASIYQKHPAWSTVLIFAAAAAGVYVAVMTILTLPGSLAQLSRLLLATTAYIGAGAAVLTYICLGAIKGDWGSAAIKSALYCGFIAGFAYFTIRTSWTKLWKPVVIVPASIISGAAAFGYNYYYNGKDVLASSQAALIAMLLVFALPSLRQTLMAFTWKQWTWLSAWVVGTTVHGIYRIVAKGDSLLQVGTLILRNGFLAFAAALCVPMLTPTALATDIGLAAAFPISFVAYGGAEFIYQYSVLGKTLEDSLKKAWDQGLEGAVLFTAMMLVANSLSTHIAKSIVSEEVGAGVQMASKVYWGSNLLEHFKGFKLLSPVWLSTAEGTKLFTVAWFSSAQLSINPYTVMLFGGIVSVINNLINKYAKGEDFLTIKNIGEFFYCAVVPILIISFAVDFVPAFIQAVRATGLQNFIMGMNTSGSFGMIGAGSILGSCLNPVAGPLAILFMLQSALSVGANMISFEAMGKVFAQMYLVEFLPSNGLFGFLRESFVWFGTRDYIQAAGQGFIFGLGLAPFKAAMATSEAGFSKGYSRFTEWAKDSKIYQKASQWFREWRTGKIEEQIEEGMEALMDALTGLIREAWVEGSASGVLQWLGVSPGLAEHLVEFIPGLGGKGDINYSPMDALNAPLEALVEKMKELENPQEGLAENVSGNAKLVDIMNVLGVRDIEKVKEGLGKLGIKQEQLGSINANSTLSDVKGMLNQNSSGKYTNFATINALVKAGTGKGVSLVQLGLISGMWRGSADASQNTSDVSAKTTSHADMALPQELTDAIDWPQTITSEKAKNIALIIKDMNPRQAAKAICEILNGAVAIITHSDIYPDAGKNLDAMFSFINTIIEAITPEKFIKIMSGSESMQALASLFKSASDAVQNKSYASASGDYSKLMRTLAENISPKQATAKIGSETFGGIVINAMIGIKKDVTTLILKMASVEKIEDMTPEKAATVAVLITGIQDTNIAVKTAKEIFIKLETVLSAPTYTKETAENILGSMSIIANKLTLNQLKEEMNNNKRFGTFVLETLERCIKSVSGNKKLEDKDKDTILSKPKQITAKLESSMNIPRAENIKPDKLASKDGASIFANLHALFAKSLTDGAVKGLFDLMLKIAGEIKTDQSKQTFKKDGKDIKVGQALTELLIKNIGKVSADINPETVLKLAVCVEIIQININGSFAKISGKQINEIFVPILNLLTKSLRSDSCAQEAAEKAFDFIKHLTNELTFTINAKDRESVGNAAFEATVASIEAANKQSIKIETKEILAALESFGMTPKMSEDAERQSRVVIAVAIDKMKANDAAQIIGALFEQIAKSVKDGSCNQQQLERAFNAVAELAGKLTDEQLAAMKGNTTLANIALDALAACFENTVAENHNADKAAALKILNAANGIIDKLKESISDETGSGEATIISYLGLLTLVAGNITEEVFSDVAATLVGGIHKIHKFSVKNTNIAQKAIEAISAVAQRHKQLKPGAKHVGELKSMIRELIKERKDNKITYGLPSLIAIYKSAINLGIEADDTNACAGMIKNHIKTLNLHDAQFENTARELTGLLEECETLNQEQLGQVLDMAAIMIKKFNFTASAETTKAMFGFVLKIAVNAKTSKNAKLISKAGNLANALFGKAGAHQMLANENTADDIIKQFSSSRFQIPLSDAKEATLNRSMLDSITKHYNCDIRVTNGTSLINLVYHVSVGDFIDAFKSYDIAKRMQKKLDSDSKLSRDLKLAEFLKEIKGDSELTKALLLELNTKTYKNIAKNSGKTKEALARKIGLKYEMPFLVLGLKLKNQKEESGAGLLKELGFSNEEAQDYLGHLQTKRDVAINPDETTVGEALDWLAQQRTAVGNEASVDQLVQGLKETFNTKAAFLSMNYSDNLALLANRCGLSARRIAEMLGINKLDDLIKLQIVTDKNELDKEILAKVNEGRDEKARIEVKTNISDIDADTLSKIMENITLEDLKEASVDGKNAIDILKSYLGLNIVRNAALRLRGEDPVIEEKQNKKQMIQEIICKKSQLERVTTEDAKVGLQNEIDNLAKEAGVAGNLDSQTLDNEIKTLNEQIIQRRDDAIAEKEEELSGLEPSQNKEDREKAKTLKQRIKDENKLMELEKKLFNNNINSEKARKLQAEIDELKERMLQANVNELSRELERNRGNPNINYMFEYKIPSGKGFEVVTMNVNRAHIRYEAKSGYIAFDFHNDGNTDSVYLTKEGVFVRGLQELMDIGLDFSIENNEAALKNGEFSIEIRNKKGDIIAIARMERRELRVPEFITELRSKADGFEQANNLEVAERIRKVADQVEWPLTTSATLYECSSMSDFRVELTRQKEEAGKRKDEALERELDELISDISGLYKRKLFNLGVETIKPIKDMPTKDMKRIEDIGGIGALKNIADIFADSITEAETAMNEEGKYEITGEIGYFDGLNQLNAIMRLVFMPYTFFEIPTGYGKTKVLFNALARINHALREAAKNKDSKVLRAFKNRKTVYITHNTQELAANAKKDTAANKLLNKAGLEIEAVTQDDTDIANTVKLLNIRFLTRETEDRLAQADLIYMDADTFMFLQNMIRGTTGKTRESSYRLWNKIFGKAKVLHDEVDTMFFRNRAMEGLNPKKLEPEEIGALREVHSFMNMFVLKKYLKEHDDIWQKCRKDAKWLQDINTPEDININNVSEKHLEWLSKNVFPKGEEFLNREREFLEFVFKEGENIIGYDNLNYNHLGGRTDYLSVMFSDEVLESFVDFVNQKTGHKFDFKNKTELNESDDKQVKRYRASLVGRCNVLLQHYQADVGHDEKSDVIKPAPDGVLAPQLELSDPYFAGHTELVFKQFIDKKEKLSELTLSNLATVTSMGVALREAKRSGADFGGFSGTLKSVEKISNLLFGINISDEFGMHTIDPVLSASYYQEKINSLTGVDSISEASKPIIEKLSEKEGGEFKIRAAFFMVGAKDKDIKPADTIKKLLESGRIVLAKEHGDGWTKYTWDGSSRDEKGDIVAVKVAIDLKSYSATVENKKTGVKEWKIISEREYKDETAKGNLTANPSVEKYLEESPDEGVVFYLNAPATRATDISLFEKLGAGESDKRFLRLSKSIFEKMEKHGEEKFARRLGKKAGAELELTEEEVKFYNTHSKILRSRDKYAARLQKMSKIECFGIIDSKTTSWFFKQLVGRDRGIKTFDKNGKSVFVTDKEGKRIYHKTSIYVVEKGSDYSCEDKTIIQNTLEKLFEKTDEKAILKARYACIGDLTDILMVEFLAAFSDNEDPKGREYIKYLITRYQSTTKQNDDISQTHSSMTSEEALQKRIDGFMMFLQNERMLNQQTWVNSLSRSTRSMLNWQIKIYENNGMQLNLKEKEEDLDKSLKTGDLAAANNISALVERIRNNVSKDMLPEIAPMSGPSTNKAVYNDAEADAKEAGIENFEEKCEGNSEFMNDDGSYTDKAKRLAKYAKQIRQSGTTSIMAFVFSGLFRNLCGGEDDGDDLFNMVLALMDNGYLSATGDNLDALMMKTNMVNLLVTRGILSTSALNSNDFMHSLKDKAQLIAFTQMLLLVGNFADNKIYKKGLEYPIALSRQSYLREIIKFHKDYDVEPFLGLPDRLFGMPMMSAPLILSLIVGPALGTAGRTLFFQAYYIIGSMLSEVSTMVGRLWNKTKLGAMSVNMAWTSYWLTRNMDKLSRQDAVFMRFAYSLMEPDKSYASISRKTDTRFAFKDFLRDNNMYNKYRNGYINRISRGGKESAILNALLPFINSDREEKDKFKSVDKLVKAINDNELKLKPEIAAVVKTVFYQIEIATKRIQQKQKQKQSKDKPAGKGKAAGFMSSVSKITAPQFDRSILAARLSDLTIEDWVKAGTYAVIAFAAAFIVKAVGGWGVSIIYLLTQGSNKFASWAARLITEKTNIMSGWKESSNIKELIRSYFEIADDNSDYDKMKTVLEKLLKDITAEDKSSASSAYVVRELVKAYEELKPLLEERAKALNEYMEKQQLQQPDISAAQKYMEQYKAYTGKEIDLFAAWQQLNQSYEARQKGAKEQFEKEYKKSDAGKKLEAAENKIMPLRKKILGAVCVLNEEIDECAKEVKEYTEAAEKKAKEKQDKEAEDSQKSESKADFTKRKYNKMRDKIIESKKAGEITDIEASKLLNTVRDKVFKEELNERKTKAVDKLIQKAAKGIKNIKRLREKALAFINAMDTTDEEKQKMRDGLNERLEQVKAYDKIDKILSWLSKRNNRPPTANEYIKVLNELLNDGLYLTDKSKLMQVKKRDRVPVIIRGTLHRKIMEILAAGRHQLTDEDIYEIAENAIIRIMDSMKAPDKIKEKVLTYAVNKLDSVKNGHKALDAKLTAFKDAITYIDSVASESDEEVRKDVIAMKKVLVKAAAKILKNKSITKGAKLDDAYREAIRLLNDLIDDIDDNYDVSEADKKSAEIDKLLREVATEHADKITERLNKPYTQEIDRIMSHTREMLSLELDMQKRLKIIKKAKSDIAENLRQITGSEEYKQEYIENKYKNLVDIIIKARQEYNKLVEMLIEESGKIPVSATQTSVDRNKLIGYALRRLRVSLDEVKKAAKEMEQYDDITQVLLKIESPVRYDNLIILFRNSENAAEYAANAAEAAKKAKEEAKKAVKAEKDARQRAHEAKNEAAETAEAEKKVKGDPNGIDIVKAARAAKRAMQEAEKALKAATELKLKKTKEAENAVKKAKDAETRQHTANSAFMEKARQFIDALLASANKAAGSGVIAQKDYDKVKERLSKLKTKEDYYRVISTYRAAKATQAKYNSSVEAYLGLQAATKGAFLKSAIKSADITPREYISLLQGLLRTAGDGMAEEAILKKAITSAAQCLLKTVKQISEAKVMPFETPQQYHDLEKALNDLNKPGAYKTLLKAYLAAINQALREGLITPNICNALLDTFIDPQAHREGSRLMNIARKAIEMKLARPGQYERLIESIVVLLKGDAKIQDARALLYEVRAAVESVEITLLETSYTPAEPKSENILAEYEIEVTEESVRLLSEEAEKRIITGPITDITGIIYRSYEMKANKEEGMIDIEAMKQNMSRAMSEIDEKALSQPRKDSYLAAEMRKAHIYNANAMYKRAMKKAKGKPVDVDQLKQEIQNNVDEKYLTKDFLKNKIKDAEGYNKQFKDKELKEANAEFNAVKKGLHDEYPPDQLKYAYNKVWKISKLLRQAAKDSPSVALPKIKEARKIINKLLKGKQNRIDRQKPEDQAPLLNIYWKAHNRAIEENGIIHVNGLFKKLNRAAKEPQLSQQKKDEYINDIIETATEDNVNFIVEAALEKARANNGFIYEEIVLAEKNGLIIEAYKTPYEQEAFKNTVKQVIRQRNIELLTERAESVLENTLESARNEEWPVNITQLEQHLRELTQDKYPDAAQAQQVINSATQKVEQFNKDLKQKLFDEVLAQLKEVRSRLKPEYVASTGSEQIKDFKQRIRSIHQHLKRARDLKAEWIHHIGALRKEIAILGSEVKGWTYTKEYKTDATFSDISAKVNTAYDKIKSATETNNKTLKQQYIDAALEELATITTDQMNSVTETEMDYINYYLDKINATIEKESNNLPVEKIQKEVVRFKTNEPIKTKLHVIKQLTEATEDIQQRNRVMLLLNREDIAIETTGQNTVNSGYANSRWVLGRVENRDGNKVIVLSYQVIEALLSLNSRGTDILASIIQYNENIAKGMDKDAAFILMAEASRLTADADKDLARQLEGIIFNITELIRHIDRISAQLSPEDRRMLTSAIYKSSEEVHRCLTEGMFSQEQMRDRILDILGNTEFFTEGLSKSKFLANRHDMKRLLEILTSILAPRLPSQMPYSAFESSMLQEYRRHDPIYAEISDIIAGVASNPELFELEIDVFGESRRLLDTEGYQRNAQNVLKALYAYMIKHTEKYPNFGNDLKCERLSLAMYELGHVLDVPIRLRRFEGSPQNHIFIEYGIGQAYMDVTTGKIYNNAEGIRNDMIKALGVEESRVAKESTFWAESNVISEALTRKALKALNTNGLKQAFALTEEALELDDANQGAHLLMMLLNSEGQTGANKEFERIEQMLEQGARTILSQGMAIELDAAIVTNEFAVCFGAFYASLGQEVKDKININVYGEKALGDAIERLEQNGIDVKGRPESKEPLKTAVIVYSAENKKAVPSIEAEQIRLIGVPEHGDDEAISPAAILVAVFELSFVDFARRFGADIGLSESERQQLFANADSYAGNIMIKPVSKDELQKIMSEFEAVSQNA